MRTFFDGEAKPLQRGAERLNREVRLQFRLQLPKRQIRLPLDDLTHPIGQGRPQGRPSPLQQRGSLVEFPTLLFDATNPRLTALEVRRYLAGTSPSVARREHLAAELLRIRLHGHLLEGAHVT
jgi:hypothetical protein